MSKSSTYSASQLVKRLKKVTILGVLSPRQLSTLAKYAKVVDFAAGETVVKRGESGNGLFLILEGSTEVRIGSRRLARLGTGQFFGEMSLFDDQPRSADVVTLRPSRLATLSKWEFWAYAASEPVVVLSVLAEMSRRLRAANNALAE
ncbi:MAG: cyclic nucleotide-binding domain-containing protein [Thermoplasmata archaeon]